MENTKVLPLAANDKKAAPNYSKGEEILNVVTHSLGAVFGIFIILFGAFKAAQDDSFFGILASVIFGACMILTYTVSSVYHGLKPSKAKRVLRVIDHCTVYLLIMGTYTGIVLAGILPYSLSAAIVVLVLEWGVGALAVTLTAVDMKKYQAFSMICYIALGWCVIAIPHIIISAITPAGFIWLLGGGIFYTVGSVLYGIGRRKRYMHGVFHIFCLVGSVMHFITFFIHCL